ncbi:MAG: flippase [Patescibacteria group bacterium]|nr:flippase [Patescibacteria group bacterium]
MFMTVASVLQKVISFVYFAIVAREVGAVDTGKYFFALAFTTIFVVFVDLGLSNVLVREGSKMKEKIQDYFSSILFVKFFLSILSYIAVVVVINLMGYEIETKHLVYVSSVTMLFDSLHLTLYSTLRAFGNLKYEAIGISMSQALTFILGTYFLFAGFPLIYLMYAFLIPSILNVLFASVIVLFKYHLKFKLKYDKQILKYIIPIVIPFALAAIFGRVYSFIDSILLSKIAGDEVLGWYSIPSKIAYALNFVPMALVAALYPKFSEYFAHDKQKLNFVFHQSIKYLLLVSLPFIVIVLLLSEDIILAFFSGEYLNSVLPLKILMFGVIFAYLNFIFGAILNACDRQKTQTSLIGVMMILNIGLNLLFIPRFGAVGASFAALIGNLVLSLFSLYFIAKFNKFDFGFLNRMFVQLLITILVMFVVTFYIDKYFGFIVAFFVGSFAYLIMLFVTRTITKKQILEMVMLTSR